VCGALDSEGACPFARDILVDSELKDSDMGQADYLVYGLRAGNEIERKITTENVPSAQV
jgi:hypothetical protein